MLRTCISICGGGSYQDQGLLAGFTAVSSCPLVSALPPMLPAACISSTIGERAVDGAGHCEDGLWESSGTGRRKTHRQVWNKEDVRTEASSKAHMEPFGTFCPGLFPHPNFSRKTNANKSTPLTFKQLLSSSVSIFQGIYSGSEKGLEQVP